jgi:Ca-activated chloride channel homolog
MTRIQKILLLALILLIVLVGLDLLLRPRSFFNSLGSQLFRLKRFESAEKLYERNHDEEDTVASGNLAKSRYKNQDLEAAAAAADEALDNSPDSADLYYDRGNIAYQQEDYQAAVENYEQALLLDPRDEDTKANLELALKKLEENPPQPEPEPKPETQEERDEEEVRNILEALDNLEARERKQQRDQTPPKTENWW